MEEKLILLSGSSTEEISCKNQLLEDMQKKSGEVKISFRQISKLDPNASNGFTFFLAAFANKDLKKDDYTLTLKMDVDIGGIKTEKEAKCTLRKDVELKEGKQVQASLYCSVDLSENEKRQIKFDDPEAIKISINNPDISGINEDEMLSPLETDKAIELANDLRAIGALTDLGECIDFSLEENIDTISIPSFEIISLISRQIGDKREKCRNGIMIFSGKFSSKITEETTFDLPLSFPQISIKCIVPKTEDENIAVSFPCKSPKFKNINSIVIEPRLLKKKNKELFFIKPINLNFIESFGCEDYNDIKYQREKERLNSNYSLLQLSGFQPPKGGIFGFFMALIKAKEQNNFDNLPVIKVHIITNETLRYLEDLVLQNELIVNINCNLRTGTSSSDLACGLDCSGNSDKGGEMEMDEDTMILGLPENTNIKSPTVLGKDYSNPENLRSINDLPQVTIKENGIDETGCEDFGNYTIQGTIQGKGLKNTRGVVIPFSIPDSSGLCDIEVNGNNVIMKCQNKEKFKHSPIIIGQTIIQDPNRTEIFILNSYVNKKSFACAISVNSSNIIISSSSSSNISFTSSSSSPTSSSTKSDVELGAVRYFRGNKSSGLSGGVIAGLIIAIVAVIAISTGLVIYFKGRKTKSLRQDIDTSERFKIKKNDTYKV